MSFNPNNTAAEGSGIFGLPFQRENAKLCLLPVPWEVTTSYGDGTSRGPEAILHASHQVDLFDIETFTAYENGYFLEKIPGEILNLNDQMKKVAQRVVAALEEGQTDSTGLNEVNKASLQVNEWVYMHTRDLLNSGKIVGVIGGDHSAPLCAIQAISEKHGADYGILHIDAHADLRTAYQGFKHSHASIMYNVMESDFRPKALVQVGIRDFSPGEYDYIQKHGAIHTFFDPLVKRRLNNGESWQKICNEMVALLPHKVYISFDIDGLMPDLCPNTGTPVPGGLSFDQALTLFATLHEAGKQIIGFDLCEVAQAEGTEWDGNVGARILFKLCGWTMLTNGLR